MTCEFSEHSAAKSPSGSAQEQKHKSRPLTAYLACVKNPRHREKGKNKVQKNVQALASPPEERDEQFIQKPDSAAGKQSRCHFIELAFDRRSHYPRMRPQKVFFSLGSS